MADTQPSSAAATAPAQAAAAPATQPTHATQANTTDYQPQAPAAQPAAAQPGVQEPQKPAIQQPAGEKPDAAAMKAYLNEKAKDVSLEGKSDADIAQLYADANAKETVAKPADAEFKLPDEYKDKPWAAKVKSIDDLYKQIDTLDALKGKKSIVPNLKDSTPEEREAFYAQLRGKDAAEYQIPKVGSVPIPEDTQPVIAKLFMENGISPTQAEPFLKGYLELREKQIAEYYNPEGFKKSMEIAFGADWEKTTGAVRTTIKSMMNADDQKALDAIPNNLLGVVYRTMGNTINAVNETLKKYGATESFAHLSAPGGKVAQTDIGSQRQTWRNELAALSMRPHEAGEKDAIIQKIADSYKNDPRLTQA